LKQLFLQIIKFNTLIWKIQAQKENALTQVQQLLVLPLKWVVQEVVQETPIGGLTNFD
jgi:hypothetical protein